MDTLHKHIMRRVYYAYAIRLATHRNTAHFALGVLAMVTLSCFVSFHAVAQNFSQVRVGQALPYVLNALIRTEIWTLLTLAVTGFLFVSALRKRATQKGKKNKLQFA